MYVKTLGPGLDTRWKLGQNEFLVPPQHSLLVYSLSYYTV